jgi:hypothetical protein
VENNTVLTGKLLATRQLVRLRYAREDNINIDVEEIEC